LDAFTTFDPRSVFALAEDLFPGTGTDLSNAWRIRQFEYTWLRPLTGSYVDFWHVTEDALVYAAKLVKIELTVEKAFLSLKTWPEHSARVTVAQSVRDEDGTPIELHSSAAVRNSGLQGIFEALLSTDRVRAYKPAPRAYQMGIDAFGVKREEIAFAAFGGWDAAGAKVFGYPTFWVNRMNVPLEELGFVPDATGATLRDLANFVSNIGVTAST
jgi:2-haloacid dehalogenase